MSNELQNTNPLGTRTERQIYGSARLGSLNTKVDVFGSAYEDYSDEITTHTIGDRNYELSNHLGNVLTVVSDKLHALDNGNGVVSGYTADLVMSCDYSPFGVTLDVRGVEGSYRYGFQGQEMDDEIKGEGNSVNYKYRMHDPRVGRFFAVDPLAAKYPHNSVYAFSENNVIHAVELEGLEKVEVHNKSGDNPSTRSYNMEGLKHDVKRIDHWDKAGNRTSVEFQTMDGKKIIEYSDISHVNAQQINRLYEKAESINEGSAQANSNQENTSSQPNLNSMIPTPSDVVAFVIAGTQEAVDQLPPGSYITFSYAKSGNRFYIKENARGLNNLKGASIKASTASTILKVAGPIVAALFEAPEIYHGYKESTEEGNKQVAGAAGNVLGGVAAGFAGSSMIAGMAFFTGPVGWIVVGAFAMAGGMAGEAFAEGVYESESDGKLDAHNRCFIQGTKITMGSGDLKNIEDVIVGDSVQTYNVKKKCIENQMVNATSSSLQNNLIEISFENNVKNVNTANHPYFVIGKGWCSVNPNETYLKYGIKVGILEIGDVCLFNDGNEVKKVKVVNILRTEGESITYNLDDISGNHNFFANGILVHNKAIEPEKIEFFLRRWTIFKNINHAR